MAPRSCPHSDPDGGAHPYTNPNTSADSRSDPYADRYTHATVGLYSRHSHGKGVRQAKPASHRQGPAHGQALDRRDSLRQLRASVLLHPRG